MMHIHLLIICVLVGSLYAAGPCPDSTPCNGVCCKKFTFGRKYWCCKPGQVCGVTQFGLGVCVTLVDEVNKAESLIEKGLAQEEEDAERQAPGYVYIYPERF